MKKINSKNCLEGKTVKIGYSDVLEAIEKELEVVAKYDDQLNVLRKYFI